MINCLLLALAGVIVIFTLLATFRKAIFAFVCSKMAVYSNKKLKANKIKLFKPLTEEAKEAGEFNYKVLEIGGGSGTNYEFVLHNVDWTVTEPNLCFKSYFEKNVKEKGWRHKVHDLVEARGEDLGRFESDSFDAVVVSLVLCSVQSVDQTLAEIRRVLKPGRSFYFIEHVGAKHGTFLRRLQDILTDWGVWPTACDGCCLNRDIEVNLRRAGFSKLDVTNYHTHSWAMYVASTMLFGRATK